MIRELVHININVTDVERSIAFYEMLGFRVVHVFGDRPTHDVGEGMDFRGNRMRGAVLSAGEHPRAHTKLELVQWLEPETLPEEPRALTRVGVSRIAIRTKNLLEFCETLRSRGLELESPPQDIDLVGATRFALLRDPDGICIELIEFAPVARD